MNFGRINLMAGCVGFLMAAAGGFALGFSMDPYFANGFYAVPLDRYLLKAGHSHAMPVALFNLIIGGILDRLALSENGKKWCSVMSVLAFIMPFGLVLRGLTDGAMTFAPVVMAGAICFISSFGLVLKGSAANPA